MRKKSKKISIIIPCYNNGKFLNDTIKSVLYQTFKNFDLYLINNGSTDNSLNIMRAHELKDKRIFVINHKKKTSKGKSVNLLLKKLKTQWVALLDADDLYFKNKIKEQINFLNKKTNIGMLSCLAKYTVDGQRTYGISNNPFINLDSCFEIIKKHKNIGVLFPGVIFDKNIVIKVGGFRDKFWPSDDIDLSNRIAENGYIVYSIPKPLMMYRMSRDSSMGTLGKFINGKKKAGWVKHSLIQRINNKKEITFKNYIEKSRNVNFYKITSNFFEDCSDFFFRQIVVYILEKKLIMVLFYMILSFIFSPLRTLKKIIFRICKMPRN